MTWKLKHVCCAKQHTKHHSKTQFININFRLKMDWYQPMWRSIESAFSIFIVEEINTLRLSSMASSVQQQESWGETLMNISRSECGRKSLSVHLNMHTQIERERCMLSMMGKTTLDFGKPMPFSLQNNICQFVQWSCFCCVRMSNGRLEAFVWTGSNPLNIANWTSTFKLSSSSLDSILR